MKNIAKNIKNTNTKAKKRKSLTVRLPADVFAVLSDEAEEISLSCPSLIRVIVTKHVNSNRKQQGGN